MRPSHLGGWKMYYGSLFGRLYEAALILSGKFSLGRAWQLGNDHQIMAESARRARGGK